MGLIATAIITVINITQVANAGRLLALADVAILLDGVEIVVHGVQVRADGDGAEVRLPNYRGPNGQWMAAVTLPEEVCGPMGDAVLAAGIEAGILRERMAAS